MSKTTIEISDEVMQILRQSNIETDRLILPDFQLDRKLYEAVNKVLAAAGGKWNRSAKAHLFSRDPHEVLGLAINTGTIVDEKKLYQAFFTPQGIADRMVGMCSNLNGLSVLEPSAGIGVIADTAKQAGGLITCVEIQDRYVNQLEKRFTTLCADFLELGINDFGGEKFDVVLMNPPFTNDQDIKHVEHALSLLKDAGRLIAIMSPGFTFGGSKIRKAFKQRVENNDWQVEDLPSGTFTDSGTEVRSVMLYVNI